jgi:signal transduction histidine kinase
MIPWQNRHPNDARPFLQPMAMVLICTVFVCLILVAGLMDLRRLDQTLVSFMESRGLDISEKIQRDAQEKFNILVQTAKGESGDTIFPITTQTFLPQESFINAIVKLTRHIDDRFKVPKPDQKVLERIAVENRLWLLVLLDDKGRIVLQSRPFSAELLERAGAVVAGEKDVGIDLFHEKAGSISLRRSSGNGTIFIVMDEQGLRYWKMKVALQKAVEEAAREQKVQYVTVMDENRSLLAGSGELPEKWGDDRHIFGKILYGRTAVLSRKITYQKRNLLEVLVPSYLDNSLIGVARIGLERDDADQLVAKNKTLMIVSMSFVILMGLLSVWFLYHNQNRHLKRIEEMGKELQKSERLSSLGQLAAGVAHEIRNPLNAISMASQRLQREFNPGEDEKREDFQRITGVIRDEIRRLNRIIEEFLAFSRSQRLELRDYPIEAVLQKLTRLIQEEAGTKGISLETSGLDTLTLIPMDVDKLQQAFLNIMKNAMESISGPGTVTIILEPQAGNGIAIRITDTGAGLKPEEVDRIFNPEYTTKEKGLGLGLSIAHEIIRSHGGDILVQSRIGAGTTFEIRLPLKAS